MGETAISKSDKRIKKRIACLWRLQWWPWIRENILGSSDSRNQDLDGLEITISVAGDNEFVGAFNQFMEQAFIDRNASVFAPDSSSVDGENLANLSVSFDHSRVCVTLFGSLTVVAEIEKVRKWTEPREEFSVRGNTYHKQFSLWWHQLGYEAKWQELHFKGFPALESRGHIFEEVPIKNWLLSFRILGANGLIFSSGRISIRQDTREKSLDDVLREISANLLEHLNGARIWDKITF